MPSPPSVPSLPAPAAGPRPGACAFAAQPVVDSTFHEAENGRGGRAGPRPRGIPASQSCIHRRDVRPPPEKAARRPRCTRAPPHRAASPHAARCAPAAAAPRPVALLRCGVQHSSPRPGQGAVASSMSHSMSNCAPSPLLPPPPLGSDPRRRALRVPLQNLACDANRFATSEQLIEPAQHTRRRDVRAPPPPSAPALSIHPSDHSGRAIRPHGLGKPFAAGPKGRLCYLSLMAAAAGRRRRRRWW